MAFDPLTREAHSVTFTITGTSKIEETIRRYIDRTKDIRTVGHVVIDHFHQVMEKQFESEGTYLGSKWAPLMPSTVASKTARGTLANGILRDTNALYDSLMGGPGTTESVDNDRITMGSSLPYLLYLDLGTTRMVSRPVFGDHQTMVHELEREWSRILADHIMGRPVIASGAIGTRARASHGYLSHIMRTAEEWAKQGVRTGKRWAGQVLP